MGGGERNSCNISENDKNIYYTHIINNNHNNNNNNNNNNNKTNYYYYYSFFYFSALSLSIAAISLFLLQGKSIYIPLWSLIISALLIRRITRNSVEKESIIIMRAFGVQLETHYKSGRIVHRFFPMDKILKPVLNECVTPVTCYWSLSLIVRGEEELVLVFKGMRPPLKMLIPIWKALCIATTCPQTPDEIR